VIGAGIVAISPLWPAAAHEDMGQKITRRLIVSGSARIWSTIA
jgi:hypothetical protein